MNEIIFPHCNKVFKIDEAGYADILKQVRVGDFEKQLHERLALAEKDKLGAVELAKTQLTNHCNKTQPTKTPKSKPCKPSWAPRAKTNQ